MKTLTKPIIERQKYRIDLKGKILGRISVEIANKLRGKNKIDFVRNQDIGDYVEIINYNQVELTRKKSEKKEYITHSGYIGGLKRKPYKELIKEDPKLVIIRSVGGMLPHNRLKKKWLSRLIFIDNNQSGEKSE